MTPVRWIVAAVALLAAAGWLLRRVVPLRGAGAWRALPAAALAALGFVPLVIGSDFLRVPVPIPPYLWKETVENHDAVGALRSAAGPLLGGTVAFWLAGRLLALALARRARARLRSM